MANTYKNIVIVPNIGSSNADPQIIFSGANTTVNTDITLKMYPDSNGTLSFEGGGTGQLFSISNSLSGVIFSVNDISGIPSIEVTDTGIIRMAQYTGNVQILGEQSSTSNTSGELQVRGGVGITGNVYTGNIVITGTTSNGITFADGTRMITAATGGGGGGGASLSGYLANTVVVANQTGFISNSTAQFFAANNTLSSLNFRTTGDIIFTSPLASNYISVEYNPSSNSLDYIFV